MASSSKRSFPFSSSSAYDNEYHEYRTIDPKAKRPRLGLSQILIDGFGEVVPQLIQELEPAVRRLVCSALQEKLQEIEPAVRLWVCSSLQETLQEFAPFLRPPPRSPLSQSQDVMYRLLFQKTLPKAIFAGNKFKAPFVLVIADSNLIVASDYLPSVTVEVVVLNGHFGGNGQVWTPEEFSRHVLTGRDGRRPLLVGQKTIKLRNGTGILADAYFTDNSSWTETKMFRLGVRVVQSKGIEGRILEAIGNTFQVKDNRVESSQKYHPLLYKDEVWRLINIWRGGEFHRRLEKLKITSVEEFISELQKDEIRLERKKVLGKRMTKKLWDATIEHAKESVQGHKLYSYCNEDGPEIDLLFNSCLQLVGANISSTYKPFNCLTPSERAKVIEMEKLARENMDQLMPIRQATGSSFLGSTGYDGIQTEEPGSPQTHFPAGGAGQAAPMQLCCSTNEPSPISHQQNGMCSFDNIQSQSYGEGNNLDAVIEDEQKSDVGGARMVWTEVDEVNLTGATTEQQHLNAVIGNEQTIYVGELTEDHFIALGTFLANRKWKKLCILFRFRFIFRRKVAVKRTMLVPMLQEVA